MRRLLLVSAAFAASCLSAVERDFAQDVRAEQVRSPQKAPQKAQQKEWLRDLAGDQPLAREIARRRLRLADPQPVVELVKLLRHDDPNVVLAAATLLRDRGKAADELRKIARHDDPVVRLAVLPVASDDVVVQTFETGTIELRVRALYTLEDRGLLTDERLLTTLDSREDALAHAACRVVVLSRSPFPIRVCDKILDRPEARRRLLEWLADRPRARSGPWLQRILALSGLTKMERMLAVSSLPPAWVDHKLAREVLRLAADDDIALSNRAGYAALRFEPDIADKLVLELEIAVKKGLTVAPLLPCLERISPTGERLLLEIALRAEKEIRAEVFHWLSSRESKLVNTFVARALDSDKPFPPELARLTSPVLTTKTRIDRVAALLDSTSPNVKSSAYDALLEAGVYHPAMFGYAMSGQFDRARRLWRILKLPGSKLPEKLFVDILEGDDLVATQYALDSLARDEFGPKIENLIRPYLRLKTHAGVQMSACRALILHGSEAVGREAWKVMRKGETTARAIRWMMEKPKPWSYENLLKERERLQKHRLKTERPTYHRVLIALARLGDRGANDELLREIPYLEPIEMQQVQKLMGRFLEKEDLEKLARKYLVVRPAKVEGDLRIEPTPDDERRIELLEWFTRRKQIDLVPILTQLWRTDESYEVRLTALRGLLARDARSLHDEIRKLLAAPYGEKEQELGFEVVGSMDLPLSDKAVGMLAHILLRAPLTNPHREIRLGLEQGYDSVRGAYPLLTPAANLLRRDAGVRPGAAFAKVAEAIASGPERYALNRQRLGLFLASIFINDALADDLGPVLARLILDAPDASMDFVGPAQMILAAAAEGEQDYLMAATLYTQASRAFNRDVVPQHVRRSFLGAADPHAGYHPLAALSARASICRARQAFLKGDVKSARKHVLRARDLAEGDRHTIEEIMTLRRELQK